jgi:hypothetical protein
VVPAALVHRDRLAQRVVGVEDGARTAEPAGRLLEVGEEAGAEAEAAPVGVDPHPLDLGRAVVDPLHRAAPDRRLVGGDDDEGAVRRCQRAEVVGAGGPDVEPGREAGVELAEVPRQRVAGGRGARIDAFEGHGRRPQQPLGRRQGRRQLLALAVRQRIDDAPGDVLGAPIEAPPFAASGRGQRDDPLAPIGRVRGHGHEIVLLELAQQPAEVPGVEPQPPTQLGHPGPRRADLEQQPRRPERSPDTEV